MANASIAGGITSVILTSSGFTAVISTISRNEEVCSGVEGTVRFLLNSGLSRILSVFATAVLNFAVLGPIRLLFVGLMASSVPTLTLNLRGPRGGVVGHGPHGDRRNIFTNNVSFSMFCRNILIAVVALTTFFVKRCLRANIFSVFRPGTDNRNVAVTFLAVSVYRVFRSFGVHSRENSILNVTFSRHSRG